MTLLIKGSKLPSWTLNGGPQGGNGAALNGPEYDGYITLTSGGEKLSLPWHVLPRKASATIAAPLVKTKHGSLLKLANLGVETGDFDVFSLTGTSPRVPARGLARAGRQFCSDRPAVGRCASPAGGNVTARTTWSSRSARSVGAHIRTIRRSSTSTSTPTTTALPDFVVFNAENGGFSASGQNLVYVANLATGAPATAVFYTDADLNSGNVIFTVPMNSSAGSVNVGVQPGTTFGFSVYAFDNYFTGNKTDAIENMLFTPGNARYSSTGDPFGTVAPRSFATVPVTAATRAG